MSKLSWIAIVIVIIIIGAFLFSGDSKIETDTGINMESIKDAPGRLLALLQAVDGSNSAGLAYALRGEGQIIHLVEADMPDPAPGSVYEGWLVDTSVSPLQFFSTGVMEKNPNGVWILEYLGNEEYPSHNRVVITEETVVDETPEVHIIEGDLN